MNLTSQNAMVAGGWTLDVEHAYYTPDRIAADPRPNPGFVGWKGWNAQGSIEAKMNGTGTITLRLLEGYANQGNNLCDLKVYKNDQELVQTIPCGGSASVRVPYVTGDRIKIWESFAMINLQGVAVECDRTTTTTTAFAR